MKTSNERTKLEKLLFFLDKKSIVEIGVREFCGFKNDYWKKSKTYKVTVAKSKEKQQGKGSENIIQNKKRSLEILLFSVQKVQDSDEIQRDEII